MIKIYTSYFANIKNLPDNIEPIAICGGIPNGYKGKWLKFLAPKWWFFSKWKENHDNDFYIENYNKEVLDKLNPEQVIKIIVHEAGNKIPCLICYEKPDNFCHRHLVANWLNEKMTDKVEVVEYIKE